jgi:hypothetical protein
MAGVPSTDELAKKAFWITITGAALYCGAVFAFVL